MVYYYEEAMNEGRHLVTTVTPAVSIIPASPGWHVLEFAVDRRYNKRGILGDWQVYDTMRAPVIAWRVELYSQWVDVDDPPAYPQLRYGEVTFPITLTESYGLSHELFPKSEFVLEQPDGTIRFVEISEHTEPFEVIRLENAFAPKDREGAMAHAVHMHKERVADREDARARSADTPA